MRVLIFSTTFVWKVSHSKNNSEVLSTTYTGINALQLYQNLSLQISTTPGHPGAHLHVLQVHTPSVLTAELQWSYCSPRRPQTSTGVNQIQYGHVRQQHPQLRTRKHQYLSVLLLCAAITGGSALCISVPAPFLYASLSLVPPWN
jgi:hypothetical protein